MWNPEHSHASRWHCRQGTRMARPSINKVQRRPSSLEEFYRLEKLANDQASEILKAIQKRLALNEPIVVANGKSVVLKKSATPEYKKTDHAEFLFTAQFEDGSEIDFCLSKTTWRAAEPRRPKATQTRGKSC